MSLRVCIPDLIAQGKVPEQRAADISARYDQLVAGYRAEGMTEAVAEATATNRVLAMLDHERVIKKRNAMLQMQKQGAILNQLRMQAGDGPIRYTDARAILMRIDKKMDVIRNRSMQTLDQMLNRYRRNVLGQMRHADELDLIGRELAGETTGDLSAKETATAMQEVMEYLRKRRNAAGGDTGKLDDYILPQRHDSLLVGAKTFDEWRAHPSIERVKVRDAETGQFATGLRREDLLRGVYQTIITDGHNSSRPGQMFAGSLANRRNDPRTLHFENFDDWIIYQKEFGGIESIYDVFVGHVSAMAREIALMESLGPNPAATLRFTQDWLEKSVKLAGDSKRAGRLTGEQRGLQDMYDELTGANKIPDNNRIALGFSTLRSVQVAAKLGSAVLSAVPDMATLLRTAAYNDVPVMKVMARYMQLWNPANVADQRLAVRAGLVTDDYMTMTAAAHRYTGEELTGEISRRLASFVIRAQGLARHTRNGQWAFGMEFLSHLTDMAIEGRSFANLDPALQKQMRGYGIGESDWDAYRATPRRNERGSDWIFPTDNEAVGEKFLQMVLTETDYGIIVPDILTRTQMNSKFRSGTWLGEIAKSSVLFKAFPWAIMNLHGRRMLEQVDLANKVMYGVGLFGLMVAGGALSAQLKMIAAGKDPQPMNDVKFLGKAIAQSGGLGLFGDLLYNSESSYGGGFLATIGGPILGQTVPNAVDATFGNAKRMIDGDAKTKPEFVKDIAGTVEKEIPLRNLWYTRIAYERLIADTIREWTDPDYAKAYDRMEKRAAEEGTDYWAPPGAGLSGIRAPDFENAVE